MPAAEANDLSLGFSAWESSVSGTPAPSGEEQTLGLTGQPTDELSEALSQKNGRREQPGININCGLPHACAHSLTCTTHVHVHTYNQTDPFFLPTKAVADLLFKTNELGSWAIELNGTQLL